MLAFLKLINRKKAAAIIILGIISGLVGFLFLAFINAMIQIVLNEKKAPDLVYVILFCCLMIAYIWSRRSLAYIIVKFSQNIFWKLRSEVLHTILKSNFYHFNKRRDQIHAVLVQDVNGLTNFSLSIIQFLSAAIMVIGCFTYMTFQSIFLSVITLCVAMLGIALYSISVYFNRKKFQRSRELENNFMRNFLDIMSGFKEIHMKPKIGQQIYNQKIRKASNESFKNNISAYTGFLNVQITGEVLFYTLIAFILIFSTFFVKETPALIVNFVFVLLYLLGSINTIMLVIPSFVQASIAAGRISKLKQELNDERFENVEGKKEISIADFTDLKVDDLMFTYENDKSETRFSVGPLNFSIDKGNVAFIYGGNGSGKTTLINAILGILQSDSGTIHFNTIKLSSSNYSEYRSLFSVIFSDFHLFEEVYGMEHISIKEINYYIELFELANKVSFENNSFSSSNLSTGQRKRLALIDALIRNNPILVLDEWAADQDPSFRKKFYTQIIPELKAKGFTIIAITHDDAYYHVADKLYKMESGRLSLETAHENIKKEMAL